MTKVAILNFANETNLCGGAVFSGSRSQEASLARKIPLFSVFFGTKHLEIDTQALTFTTAWPITGGIYSKNIPYQIKGHGTLNIDVISAAAPSSGENLSTYLKHHQNKQEKECFKAFTYEEFMLLSC